MAQFGHLTEGRAPYLLDAHDRHRIIHASVLAFSDQLIVDLASAENHSLHPLWVDSCGPVIWDYPLKVCACGITNTQARLHTETNPTVNSRTEEVRGFPRQIPHLSCRFSPGSMSSKLDLASGWRSSDLGVNTISWCRSDKHRKSDQRPQHHVVGTVKFSVSHSRAS